MKMVKSLFLGSAAGLVAMTGAQAADLPVKAKPVQYVKICSLYGAGFYYIPGTDMCLKIGGWVRAEYAFGNNGSSTAAVVGDVNNRATNNSWWRTRGYITADARNQTEYGTVRSYIAVGLSTQSTGLDNAANQFDANRAFIQLAGFTIGRTQSFYDFYSSPAVAYSASIPYSDSGDTGWQVMSYTAQFGNGLSASIGAEQRRVTQIFNANAIATGASSTLAGSSFSTAGSTATGAGAYAGNNAPDIVGNLRVDQAWGSAQVMGALHELNASYYSTAAGTLENSGHPGDKWGFAVGAGIKIVTPMIGPGDYFQAQVNYTQGALRYVYYGTGTGNEWIQHGQKAAYGLVSDSVFGVIAGAGTPQELTTAWNINASYEHYWNKAWKTSVYTGYAATSYDTAANGIVCTAQGFGAAGVAAAGCNNNWNTWWVGSRTQWNVSADTYLGLDAVYSSLQGASSPTGFQAAGNIPASTATTAITTSTVGNFITRFRVHKDFYP